MPSPEELESQAQHLLSRLPDRSPSAGFEARVMKELARRAALPWWKRSYAAWPAAARVLFFAGSALAATLLVLLVGRASSTGTLWLTGGSDLLSDLGALADSLYHHVPALWVDATLGVFAFAYLLLMGAGSALYRGLVRPTTLSQ